MLPLPILNVRLQPCHEDWQLMTPTAQGSYCAACQRMVQDFTAATQPDLDAARAASPDGRVCGRFRAAQLAPRPRLRPGLRRFLVALVLVCGLGLTSQEAWAQVQKANPTSNPPQSDVVYGSVEQLPVFKGGQKAMLKLLTENLRWPPEAPAVEGQVFISFVVNTQGRVRGANVVRSLHPLFDAEALRVVQLFDDQFEPGKQNDRPVDVNYTVPITFRR